MTAEELRILLIAPAAAGGDAVQALGPLGFAVRTRDRIAPDDSEAQVDAIGRIGADPAEVVTWLADCRDRLPGVPVFLIADLPPAEEARLLAAGVETIAPVERVERLAAEIRRAVARARAAADLPRLERQLAAAQERLNGLVERVNAILYEVDPVTGDFVEVSPQAETLLGYPLSDWTAGGFWSRHCHPADLAAADAQWRNDAMAGRSYSLEYRMIGADGRIVWFHDWGTLLRRPGGESRITGLMVDVSRIKEIEETSRLLAQLTARHTGEEFFRTLVLVLTRALGIRFALIGEVTGARRDRVATVVAAADGELVEVAGYPLESGPCAIVAGGTPHFVATGARTRYPESPTIARFGAESYFGLPLFGSDDQPIGILAVMDDTAFERTESFETVLSLSAARAGAELERRRAEEERAVLQSQLVQSQRLEAIGTLAGGIAHDFNNILMGILGNAEMARDELEEWNPVHGYLSEILRASHRARDVVQRILTFGRKRAAQRQPVALGQIIGDAAVLLRATLPATIELEVDLAHEAPPIDADAGQVHQVVMNLATNAAHAIGSSPGTITIREEIVDVDPELARTHVRLQERRYLRLSVTDTGPGIEDANLARIFEPFFTTKAPGEGTGLGLAVVHGIVEDHDGAITVETAAGRGTTFRIYLPAADRRAPARRSAIPRGQGEHILLVDDEPAIVKVAAQMLERIGYRVTAVGGVDGALDAFRAAPDDFDLVLSDLTMPQQSGLELCRRIRLLNPEVGFVLATGHPDAIEGPLPEGVDAVLSKPFATARLAHVLDRILRPRVTP